jgi:hypothetical protein
VAEPRGIAGVAADPLAADGIATAAELTFPGAAPGTAADLVAAPVVEDELELTKRRDAGSYTMDEPVVTDWPRMAVEVGKVRTT